MARRQKDDFDIMSPFAKWLTQAVEEKGLSLKRTSEIAGVDYSYLYKVQNSYQPQYSQYRRPGYEKTVALGKALGDLDGALDAANYNDLAKAHAKSMTEFIEKVDVYVSEQHSLDDNSFMNFWLGLSFDEKYEIASKASGKLNNAGQPDVLGTIKSILWNVRQKPESYGLSLKRTVDAEFGNEVIPVVNVYDEDAPGEPFIDELRQAGYLNHLPPATQEEIMDYIRFKAEQARSGTKPAQK